MKNLVTSYFECFHSWMPMVSSAFVGRVLENPVTSIQADTCFLLSCMKLILAKPESGEIPKDLPIYRIVKTAGLQLEMNGLQSLKTIQGELLIALYESGHGIYQASYTTVARCARQAISLGIHIRESPRFLQPWPEWEEEVRVWWFVVMLDRYTRNLQ